MLVWVFIFAASPQPQMRGDCGAARYAEEISQTRQLVTHEVPVEPYVGELPTPEGHWECVRAEFSIGLDGKAIRINMLESSGDVGLSLNVRRALEAYRFDPPFFGWMRRYTLVFSAVENKVPAGYFDGSENWH